VQYFSAAVHHTTYSCPSSAEASPIDNNKCPAASLRVTGTGRGSARPLRLLSRPSVAGPRWAAEHAAFSLRAPLAADS
jgi:hypothetical protein